MSYTPNTAPGLKPLTLTYKVVQDVPIYLDVYPPLFATEQSSPSGAVMYLNGSDTPVSVPAVVYFHGGGLTVGNRQSWFPCWMQERVAASGYAFISADYRLMAPATGHDIAEDIKDVFTFISERLNPLLDQKSISRNNNSRLEGHAPAFSRFHVDSNAIAVAGTSAGGWCAYYAATHVSPKPKAVLGMYAMGGDYLTPQYLNLKTVPFFRGREILDPSHFSEYLHPFPDTLELSTDSPLIYHPASSPTPGYPANPRMFVTRLYLQLGTLLDYLTGEHNPSLSATLRESLGSDKHNLATSTGSSDKHDAVNERLKALIPEHHHDLFPQFCISPDWPPTYLVHGTIDTAVLLHDSRHMHNLLKKAGVNVKLDIVEGEEHSFDYKPEAEAVYGTKTFDSVGQFLREHLEKARGNRR